MSTTSPVRLSAQHRRSIPAVTSLAVRMRTGPGRPAARGYMNSCRMSLVDQWQTVRGWPAVPGTASRFCCGCTRSASMAARRSLTGGSMRHWQPDRSIMQGSRSPPGPPDFALRPGEMRQDPSRVYPATSDIRRQLAASGCGRGSGDDRAVRRISPGQGWFYQVERRAWDSNPRGRVNALMVFKTIAIGH
jgi:hypothetical protein